jgi:hypothetical protein
MKLRAIDGYDGSMKLPGTYGVVTRIGTSENTALYRFLANQASWLKNMERSASENESQWMGMVPGYVSGNDLRLDRGFVTRDGCTANGE